MINWREISGGPRDGSTVWGFGGNLHKATIYRIRWWADEAVWIDEWSDNADVTHFCLLGEINVPGDGK